jgi:hypothetical protein
MTITRGLRSVCVPPAPLVTTLSGRLAPVCPAAAPSLSWSRAGAVPTALLAVLAASGNAWLSLGRGLTAPTAIGSHPWTR